MSTPVLHDYQQVAVDHFRRNPRAGLFLDMGLGKTAVALSSLTPDLLPALVIAPKRVAETVWSAESRIWRPDLHVAVAAGSATNRVSVLLLSLADVVVVGRDNLKDVPVRGWRSVIIDELSGFKDRSSNRWRLASRIVHQPGVRAVWGLTGTPSPNGLLDLWSQLHLLDRGARLGTSITGYRNRYFIARPPLPNGIIPGWDPRPETPDTVHRLIDDICLSMSSEGRIDLPPVTHNVITVQLPPAARHTYREFKKTLVADLPPDLVVTAGSAATLTNKLSQISAGFIYPDIDDPDHEPGSYRVLHSEKIRAVQEVIEGTGSPVLVFYRYRAEREMLLEAIPDAVPVEAPDAIERWNDGTIRVMLAHPASAGHGLNLQHGGHTIVWTSLTWSLEEWQQANKRLARQGQQHPVIIHSISAAKTVDQVIAARLGDKTSVQDALLSHLESPL